MGLLRPPLHRRVVQAQLHEVRHPQGEAVDDHQRARVRVPQRRLQLAGRLDRAPAGRPLGAVPLDPRGHLGVAGLGGDHHLHRAGPGAGGPGGQGGLAAARAAEQQGQRHQ